MNLSVLREIRKRYENFNELVRTYKKEGIGTLSSNEVKAVKETIEDLFVLEIFSCFERFLRDKLVACLELESCPFSKEQVRNHIEFMKIEELLDSLKGGIDPISIGYLKQIKRYRDWIAHGRNPQKPPPVRTVDFDRVFEIIELIMEELER